MAKPLGRFEGRLFAEGGCLFMVVHADEAAGTARVSCRVDRQTQVIDMPLAHVAKRVSTGAQLVLDNLNGPESTRRIRKSKDGWHFSTREGQMGPFATEQEAARQLGRYILCMQTEPPVRKGPRRAEPAKRPAPGRRSEDHSQRVAAL
ncbi:MAG: DUF6316 family protein [Pseudomonadales bacterium]